jgi:hypothetical protein
MIEKHLRGCIQRAARRPESFPGTKPVPRKSTSEEYRNLEPARKYRVILLEHQDRLRRHCAEAGDDFSSFKVPLPTEGFCLSIKLSLKSKKGLL